jgi:hypothetical protein
MKRFVYSCVFVVTSALAAACGGGSSDDRLVSSLSDQDFIDVCESISYSDAELRGIAGLNCLLTEAFSQDGCMQARLDTCIDDEFAALQANPGECEAPDADDPIRMCDATVDQVMACTDANIAALTDFGDATCADLESGEGETPAACEALYEICPELDEDAE